jgi:hypothetical protein
MHPAHRAFRFAPVLAVAAAAALNTSVHSAVIVSGDVDVTGGTGSLEITHDIEFTITSSGNLFFVVFDDWVGTSDGGLTALGDSPAALLSYRIDGGSIQTRALGNLYDNNLNAGSIDPRDGFFVLESGLSLVAGQTLTILAQTHTYSGNSTFNPAAKQVFTGDVFLASSSASVMSSPVSLSSVPEPSEWAAAAGVGLLGFAVWRRRVRAAVG